MQLGRWGVVIAVWLPLGSGCSVAFSKAPPRNHDQLASFDCSRSVVPPILDMVWVGVQALTLGAAASTDAAEWERRHAANQKTVMISSAVQMGVFGLSAIYGVYAAASCRGAERNLVARTRPSGAPVAAPVAPPPWQDDGEELETHGN